MGHLVHFLVHRVLGEKTSVLPFSTLLDRPGGSNLQEKWERRAKGAMPLHVV